MLALKQKLDERRASPRRRMLLRDASLLDGRPDRILRCTIKDLSDGGARVRVGTVEVVGDEVTLIDPKDGTERRCRIAWRSDTELGLAFEGPVRRGRPRSMQPP